MNVDGMYLSQHIKIPCHHLIFLHNTYIFFTVRRRSVKSELIALMNLFKNPSSFVFTDADNFAHENSIYYILRVFSIISFGDDLF